MSSNKNGRSGKTSQPQAPQGEWRSVKNALKELGDQGFVPARENNAARIAYRHREHANVEISLNVTPQGVKLTELRAAVDKANGEIREAADRKQQEIRKATSAKTALTTFKISRPEPEPIPVLYSAKRRPPITDFVIDTSVLANLCAPRNGGRTWLDLIRLLAKLPTARIVIPSVIADFEFCGRIPRYKSGAITYDDFDPKIKNFRTYPQYCSLAEDASRIIADGKGGSTEIKGKEPNIFVWDNPGQQAFFKEIAEEKNRLAGIRPSLPARQIREAIHEKTANKGEGFILEYTQSSECRHPVIFVSSDLVFNRKFEEACRASPLVDGTYTLNGGHAIGFMDTPAFLATIERAYGTRLGELLPQCFGGAEPDTSTTHIIETLNAHEAESGRTGFLSPDKRGEVFLGRDKDQRTGLPPIAVLLNGLREQALGKAGIGGTAGGHDSGSKAPSR